MTTKNPFLRQHLIRDAISQALYDAMKLDPSIYLFGEGAMIKQHYDAPQIERDFPDRVVTLPISEDANTNFAVGAALLGVKPVVDIITADFLYRACDSICNTAAKLNFVQAEGEPPKTIVVRAEFLMGGPTTGQRPEMLFARIPGLNVVVPSTPRDAYGLMRTALETPGVTLFFEDRMIRDADFKSWHLDYSQKLKFSFGWQGNRVYAMNMRLVVLAYGLMSHVVQAVIEQEGLDNVQLVDLQTLFPLDVTYFAHLVQQTGKLLIVEPDVCFGGIGAELIAQLHEQGIQFTAKRLGAPREVIPASREGQARMLPSREQILEAIHGFGTL